MPVFNKHQNLYIGMIFSIVSFAFTFTFVIPIWSVLLSSFLQQALSALFPHTVYVGIGKMMIALLSALLLLVVYLVVKTMRHKRRQGKILSPFYVVKTMLITYLIVHPLGFYLYLGIILDFQLDAQYLLGVVNSFPFSSLFFVVFGFLLDQVEGKKTQDFTCLENRK